MWYLFCYDKWVCTWNQEGFYRLHKPLIQSSHKRNGNLCFLSGLRWSCVALTIYVHLYPSVRMSTGVPLLFLCASMLLTIRLKHLYANTILNLYMTNAFCVIFKCVEMLLITNSAFCGCWSEFCVIENNDFTILNFLIFCEWGSRYPDSVKCGDFLDYLWTCWIVRNISSPSG